MIMPAKIEGLKRFTVTLNEDMLTAAQVRAAKVGVPPKISGNTSAFLRYLLKEFADQPLAELKKKVSWSEI